MRTLPSWLGLLGTLALAGLPAPAGAQAVGSEFQVNTYTTGSQQTGLANHAVAAAASGNFVVVWESQGQDGAGTGIFGQRFDAGGQRLGVEFRVNSRTALDQRLPAVAAAAGGDFVVVWTDRDGHGDAAQGGIVGQRYDSAGAPVGDQFRVNSYTTNNQTLPAVASDPLGNFVVVWASDEQDGSFYGIFGQRYDSGGARLGSEFLVNSFTNSIQWFPSVASDSSGNFVIVWESYYHGGDYSEIWGQRYDSAGQRLGAEFHVNTTTKDLQKHPAVASDPLGNFVVVWSRVSYGYGGAYEIFGQRYDSAGVPQGGEFAVQASDQPTLGQDSSVAYDASGEFLVAWNGPGDGSQLDTFGRGYDSAGVPKGEPFQINVYTTDFQVVPSVAASGPGQFVVAWDSDGQDSSGDGVFGRRVLNPAGQAGGFSASAAKK